MRRPLPAEASHTNSEKVRAEIMLSMEAGAHNTLGALIITYTTLLGTPYHNYSRMP